MKLKTNVILIFLNACFFTPVVSQTWQEFERKRDLDFTVYLDKEEYLIYEPLWVHCVIENKTSQSIPAYTPRFGSQARIYVISASGDTVGYRHSIPSIEYILPEPMLEPGESKYSCQGIYCDFERLEPGTYSIQVRYRAQPAYYRKYYEEDINHERWKNYGEFQKNIREIGDILSNRVYFKVVEPNSETDKDVYAIFVKAMDEWNHKNFDQLRQTAVSLIERYPSHPYALVVYPPYLSYSQNINYNSYKRAVEDLIRYFPNTTTTYTEVHNLVQGMNKQEREKYLQELKSVYEGQWLGKLASQLDDRYKAAEASGWDRKRKVLDEEVKRQIDRFRKEKD